MRIEIEREGVLVGHTPKGYSVAFPHVGSVFGGFMPCDEEWVGGYESEVVEIPFELPAPKDSSRKSMAMARFGSTVKLTMVIDEGQL